MQSTWEPCLFSAFLESGFFEVGCEAGEPSVTLCCSNVPIFTTALGLGVDGGYLVMRRVSFAERGDGDPLPADVRTGRRKLIRGIPYIKLTRLVGSSEAAEEAAAQEAQSRCSGKDFDQQFRR